MRFRLSDLLLFALLFVFIAAFPVDLIPIDLTYQILVRIGLRALLITYYIYIIYKYRIKIFGIANIKNLLLCLPFFIICGSNFVASSIVGGFAGPTMGALDLSLYIVYTLMIAVSEEIVFRLFIHNNLLVSSSIKRIFASAGIFALMHLLNVVNVRAVSSLVTVLIQTVYTFGLGLLLGVMYEYSYSLIGCITLHFLFNLCNDTLYQYFGGYTSTLCFYITAAITGVIVLAYATMITLFYFQKHDQYFRR